MSVIHFASDKFPASAIAGLAEMVVMWTSKQILDTVKIKISNFSVDWISLIPQLAANWSMM